MPSNLYDPVLSADGTTEAAVLELTPEELSTPGGWRGLCRRLRSNNPYEGNWAKYYDFILSVPPIGQIRKSEERTLDLLMAAAFRPTDRLLEIGPGTGRTTVQFADRVAHVTAVEQSAEMVELLYQRLERNGVGNCSVLHGDFAETHFGEQFDVVALVGVLDYIPDPQPFLARAARLARRELLFTPLPTAAPWPSSFAPAIAREGCTSPPTPRSRSAPTYPASRWRCRRPACGRDCGRG